MKRLNKLLATALSLTLLAGALTACGGSPSTPGGTAPSGGGKGTKEIVIGHVYSETHNINVACKEFKEYVEKESGGSLTVNIQPNSVLGGDEDMLEMCAVGTVTLMTPSVASMEVYAPDWSIVSLPYLYNSAEQAYAALDGELGDYLKDTLADTEYLCVGFNSNGNRNMTNNVRPITQVSDLKGIKMRVMNSATYITWMNALGANATPMGFNEVFTGLQQGTVEGQENSASLIFESKFNEVQKYLSVTEHIYDMNAIICNRAFYDGLTDAEKQIFDTGIETYLSKHQREMEAASDADYIKQIEDSGVAVNYLTDEAKEGFRTALADVYANSKSTLGEQIWSLVEKYQ